MVGLQLYTAYEGDKTGLIKQAWKWNREYEQVGFYYLLCYLS